MGICHCPAPCGVVQGGVLVERYGLIRANLREVIVNQEAMTEESLRMSTQNIASRLDETLVFAWID